MTDEILKQLQAIPPKDKNAEIIQQQEQIIISLSKTQETLEAKIASSKERYASVSQKIVDVVNKLTAIRAQLTTITNRINELKKISQKQQQNQQENSADLSTMTQNSETTPATPSQQQQ